MMHSIYCRFSRKAPSTTSVAAATSASNCLARPTVSILRDSTNPIVLSLPSPNRKLSDAEIKRHAERTLNMVRAENERTGMAKQDRNRIVRFGKVQIKPCGMSEEDRRDRLSYETRNKNLRGSIYPCLTCNETNNRRCECNRWDRATIGGLPVSIDESEAPVEPTSFLRRVSGYFGLGNRASIDQASAVAANEPVQAAVETSRIPNPEAVASRAAVDNAADEPMQAVKDEAVAMVTLQDRRRARLLRQLDSTLDGYYWTCPSRRAPVRS